MPEWRPGAKWKRQGRWSQDRGHRPAEAEARGSTPDRRKDPCLLRGSTSEGEAARPDRRERRRKDGTRKHARSGRRRGNARTVARAPATARPMWSGTADAAGLKAERKGKLLLAGGTGRPSGLEEYRPDGWEPKGRERRKDAVSSGAGKLECQQRRQWGPAAMPALICVWGT